jgi:hypothetical protein
LVRLILEKKLKHILLYYIMFLGESRYFIYPGTYYLLLDENVELLVILFLYHCRYLGGKRGYGGKEE